MTGECREEDGIPFTLIDIRAVEFLEGFPPSLAIICSENKAGTGIY